VLTILIGDVMAKLAEIPDNSVQCVVTSPPYWGLRDYSTDGQIGLEKTPEEYVAKLVLVFREVKRVLRKDGTCWVNLGDSYAGSIQASTWRPSDENNDRNGDWCNRNGLGKVPGLKPKDLVGIPWRIAFALQADGWWLRSDIIWAKPNPMPESVTDRPTKSHEYIFLLTKSERYYFDQDAVRENVSESQIGRIRNDKFGGKSWQERQQHSEGGTYETRRSGNDSAAQENFSESLNGYTGGMGDQQAGRGLQVLEHRRNEADQQTSRNIRSVWNIATQPYAEAHFATFPEELPKRCILAGSKPGDTILDPFGGSGTVGKVALELGRRAILIELNPKYVEMIERRCQVTLGFNF
jgi:DNA modification methylase